MKKLMPIFSCRQIVLVPVFFIMIPMVLLGESFLSWDDLLGRTFEAKVVSVEARTVKLENRGGKQIDFPLSDLMPSSRDQVNDWLKKQREQAGDSADEAQVAHETSVFDEILIGNLDGKNLGNFRGNLDGLSKMVK